MPKEIIVNADERQTRIAIVQDGDLVELYIEDPEHKRTIGNIVLGRVRKVMPSIRAAFVDIGQESDAFLHFSDVGENLPVILDFLSANPPRVESVKLPPAEQGGGARGGRRGKRRRPKGAKKGGQGGDGQENASGGSGKRRGRSNAQKRKGRRKAQKRFSKKGGPPPEETLKRGQTVMVKIVKEPIANKGSRISTDISLAGRFLVLMPLSNFVAVSKKIAKHKERRRLKALAQSLLPEGFGAIVRTVAEGRDAKALDTDLKLLLDRWNRLEKRLESKPRAPVVLHEDVDMVSSIIRDLFSDEYDRIVIDDRHVHQGIRSYVQSVAPQMADRVEHYGGKKPVFEAENIRLSVERAFERRVELPTGGYLFIERTEAMHVIDVNSGRSGKGMSQEQNSLKVNLEAARVAARQIRLRDLGGIIVVDFIDLRSSKNRKKVYDELKGEFAKDRAVTKLLPMSDFGLMQITRQRLRPSITTTFSVNGIPADGDEDAEKNGSEAPRSAHESEVRRLRHQVERLERQAAEHRRAQEQQAAAAAKQKQPPPPAASGEAGEKASEEIERLKNKVRHMSDAVQTARQEAASARQNARPQERSAPQDEAPVPPAPEKIVEAIEAWVGAYRADGGRRAVTLCVHPFTAAYLNRSLPNYPTRWFMRHLVRVRVEPMADLSPLAYRFLDSRSGEDLTARHGPDASSGQDDAPRRRAAAS